MRNEECTTCKKPLKIAENKEEAFEGDEFYAIVFNYATFFFCSKEHSEEYAL